MPKGDEFEMRLSVTELRLPQGDKFEMRTVSRERDSIQCPYSPDCFEVHGIRWIFANFKSMFNLGREFCFKNAACSARKFAIRKSRVLGSKFPAFFFERSRGSGNPCGREVREGGREASQRRDKRPRQYRQSCPSNRSVL